MDDSYAGTGIPDPPVKQFWWLHDARWYQGVAKRFGQQAANDINAEALRFVARRIASWAARNYDLTLGRRPMADFVREFARIPELMWPDGTMEVAHTALSESEWETAVTKNFALEKLRAAGSLDGYACPCLDMRAGWFEALELDVSDRKVECLRDGTACRFRTTVKREPT